MAYPFMDIMLLTASIRLAVDAGKRGPPSTCSASASSACSPRTPSTATSRCKGTYNQSVLAGSGLGAYYILWGAAALHPSMRNARGARARQASG